MAALFAISAGERLPALVALFLPVAVLGVVLAAMGRGGGRAAVVPAVAAAVVWGGILALSAPAADDLGGYWSFLLTRGAALVVCFGLVVATGAPGAWLADRWRVAAWGIGDSAAYLLFLVAAERGPVSVASVLVAQFATVAVVVGVLVGGERLLRRQVIGVALVIVAVTGIAAAGG